MYEKIDRSSLVFKVPLDSITQGIRARVAYEELRIDYWKARIPAPDEVESADVGGRGTRYINCNSQDALQGHKAAREQLLQWLAAFGLRTIDSVELTFDDLVYFGVV